MEDAGIPVLLQPEVKVGLLSQRGDGCISVCVRGKNSLKWWAGLTQMEPLLDRKFYLLIHKLSARGLLFNKWCVGFLKCKAEIITHTCT